MSGSLEIRFGGEDNNYIALVVLGRSYPNASDYWDGNWLNAKCVLSIGAFSGQPTGFIRAEELRSFYDELTIINQKLKGRVDFQTMENWLEIEVKASKMGHIHISGLASDNFGGRNSLSFHMETDQTFLKKPLKQLEIAIQKFPTVGKRS